MIVIPTAKCSSRALECIKACYAPYAGCQAYVNPARARVHLDFILPSSTCSNFSNSAPYRHQRDAVIFPPWLHTAIGSELLNSYLMLSAGMQPRWMPCCFHTFGLHNGMVQVTVQLIWCCKILLRLRFTDQSFEYAVVI